MATTSNLTDPGANYAATDAAARAGYAAILTACSNVDVPTYTECTDANYQRQAITWGTAGSRQIANTNAITNYFNKSGATGAAGAVTASHIGLFAASTGGTPNHIVPDAKGPIAAGDTMFSNAGDIVISFPATTS